MRINVGLRVPVWYTDKKSVLCLRRSLRDTAQDINYVLSRTLTIYTVAGFSDAWMTAQNFEGMNSYNPNYMITPEVSHEFNLLNDFLHTSLLDDNGVPPEDNTQQQPQNQAFRRQQQLKQEMPDMMGFGGGGSIPQQGGQNQNTAGSMLPPPNVVDGKGISRPASALPGDLNKTREYYLQAADPSGSDNPEERMGRVLRAKYDAGLLKPFNYINGYARLGKYLDGHIAASSKQKILRTINQFRPKFREKAQGLTDMQLVFVEMWFERQLMDYDRVFASMAVPACCWRRTGEIFRGNKEMAELIDVPVDKLRDVSSPSSVPIFLEGLYRDKVGYRADADDCRVKSHFTKS